MRMFKLVVLLFTFGSLCYIGNVDGVKHLIPHRSVNLDLPPEERWLEITGEYRTQIQGLVGSLQTNLTQGEIDELDSLGFRILPHLGIYAQEIKSIAVDAGVSPGLLAVFNVAYELSAHCTSIIARKNDGSIIHGRNMDYRFLADHLRNMTMQVSFQKGNQTVYDAMMFVGYVGVLTAVKPQLVTVSIDLVAGPPWETLATIIESIITQEGKMISLIMRDVLGEDINFDQFVNSILDNEYAAQSFIILSGMKVAGVITQDRHSTLDIWPLDGDAWYRVETNYFHWDPTPPIDNRRETAESDLNKIGQENIDLKGIYQVLSDPPVLNIWTIYTALMDVETGTMWGDVRDKI